MADQFSVGTIDALSRALARWLGPIARLIVKQALQETTDVEMFLHSLSSRSRPTARSRSFDRPRKSCSERTSGLASARAQEKISDIEIKAAVEALIPDIGPLARHIVTREAQTAVGRDDFYRRLADRIPDEREKARFVALRDRPAGSRTH